LTAADQASGVRAYPMTYEQEAMWIADHLDDRPSSYLESWVYLLSGRLDLDATEWAITQVVARHEALRSSLVMDGDRLVQIVRPGADMRVLRRWCRAESLDDELRATVSQPLDLDRSPLRATVLHIAQDQVALIIQFHHAVVDDWALAVLDREFSELYRARVDRRTADLPPVSMQLGEYALAQRSAGIDPAILDYWRGQLRTLPEQRPVLADRPRPATPSRTGGQVRFAISPALGQLVRGTARTARTTPFTVFAAALTALLCWYNDASELILGTPVSRRGAECLDEVMGPLTDVMPLRQLVRWDASFADLIMSTKAVLLGALSHKDVPYATLVTEAVPRKERRNSPLCPAVLVVDDAPRVPLDLPGITATRRYVPSGKSKFDLALNLVIDAAGYQGTLDYALDLYERGTALRMTDDFLTMLGKVLDDRGKSLSEILHGVVPSR
jgi:hypothetical protein